MKLRLSARRSIGGGGSVSVISLIISEELSGRAVMNCVKSVGARVFMLGNVLTSNSPGPINSIA